MFLTPRLPVAVALLVLASRLSHAGTVTLGFSGSAGPETFSGQIAYDTSTPDCALCLIRLAGPVELTVSDLSGVTLTSILSTPTAVLSFDDTLSGEGVVLLTFSPFDNTTGFNISGPDARFLRVIDLDFDFVISTPAPSFFPNPFPFPDLAQAQSVSYQLDMAFAIERISFGGSTASINSATTVAEPSAGPILSFAALALAIYRLRRTSSIL